MQICEAMVKERPILFSGEMVRAILDGRKTQTRRVVKPQPYYLDKIMAWFHKGTIYDYVNERWMEKYCPYGAIGEKLWVKEKFVPTLMPTWDGAIETAYYRADFADDDVEAQAETWKSPLFMPKKLARIRLEITGVRVERLHDITETDAISEGVTGGGVHPDFHVGAYRDLWEQINGKGSWSLNSWVWVISFRRVQP